MNDILFLHGIQLFSILDKCVGITCLDGNNEQANSCEKSSGTCNCKVNFYKNPTSNACEEGTS